MLSGNKGHGMNSGMCVVLLYFVDARAAWNGQGISMENPQPKGFRFGFQVFL